MPVESVQDAYAQALRFIFHHADYARTLPDRYTPDVYDTSRVERLLRALGRPQDRFASVHIAGTKGKGSTAAMVEAMLRAAGHRTALFTSPSLHTTREYFRINGELLSEEEIVHAVDEIRPAVLDVAGITAFEILTALAYYLFAGHGVEIAVIEALMGGRLDATNVITPAVSVITSISYDHTQFLGDTLGKIAFEKAGIIKAGVPVVCAPQEAEAMAVIAARCRELESALILVGRDWTFRPVSFSTEGQVLDISSSLPSTGTFPQQLNGLEIPLLGAHQRENAALAVATVAELARKGWHTDEEAVRAGMRRVSWPGRMEILGRRPWVMVDGAHNVESMHYLVQSVRELFPSQRVWLLFGASADKDLRGMFAELASLSEQIILFQSKHPRAASLTALAAAAGEAGLQAHAAGDADDALAHALARASAGDLILGTGSLFIAADLRRAWAKRRGLPLPPEDPPL